MSFYHSEKPVHLKDINERKVDFEGEEIFYFRRFHDLHDKIFEIYRELYNEKVYDNGLYILLEKDLLVKLEEWFYDYLKGVRTGEEFDYPSELVDLENFYNLICSMIYRTKHGEYFYYEGDY